MKLCREFKAKIIDFIENQLSTEENRTFAEHLKSCAQCQSEYVSLKKLYAVLEHDEVVLPASDFFENLRVKIRQRPLVLKRRFHIPKFAKVLVPVAIASLIFLVFYLPNRTVEMIVPVSNLVEDQEIASYALSKIVDEELINDLTNIEASFEFKVNEAIDELTPQEQSELIKSLQKKYGIEI